MKKLLLIALPLILFQCKPAVSQERIEKLEKSYNADISFEKKADKGVIAGYNVGFYENVLPDSIKTICSEIDVKAMRIYPKNDGCEINIGEDLNYCTKLKMLAVRLRMDGKKCSLDGLSNISPEDISYYATQNGKDGLAIISKLRGIKLFYAGDMDLKQKDVVDIFSNFNSKETLEMLDLRAINAEKFPFELFLDYPNLRDLYIGSKKINVFDGSVYSQIKAFQREYEAKYGHKVSVMN